MIAHPVIHWWDDDASETRHEYLFKYVKHLEEQNAATFEKFLQNAWLYHRQPLMGLDGEFDAPPDPYESTTNLCEHAVDTAWSMIAKYIPRVAFQTDGADWSLQKQAMQLERWYEAERNRMTVDEDAQTAFRDAEVFGTAALYEFEEDGRPQVEPVLIDELRVDVKECRRSKPTHIYRVRFVDRQVLKARTFVDTGEKEEAVDAAPSGGAWTWFRHVEDGLVAIIEGWCLSHGGRQGRHIVAVENAVLVDEEFDEPELPFLFLHWSPPLAGFYGRGLVDQLTAKQFRTDKRSWTIQRGEDLAGCPRLFLHPNDAHLVNQINNDPEKSIHVTKTGKEYQFQKGQAWGPDIYLAQRRDVEEAFEFAGISMTAASGQKPAGVESAIAIREVAERESGPFALHAQRYEKLHLELAKKVIARQKRIAARGKTEPAKWNSGNLLRLIPWESVDMDEHMYTMSLAAASGLPKTPAARTQYVIELAQANAIDRDEMRALLDHPDLRKSNDVAVAHRRDIERTVEILMEEDQPYPVPETYQDLTLGVKLVGLHLLDVKTRGAPEDVLERFRNWIEQAQGILDAAAAKMQAQMAMAQQPPGQPGGDMKGLPNASPMNPAGGLNDAFTRLSPQAMGLPPR